MNNLIEKIKKIPLEYYLFILMILPCFLISKQLDNDTYFILKHGEYVVKNGIPIIEPFTMHQDLNFVMQQWLFAVIIYVIYTYVSQFVLILFIISIFICATIILQKTLFLISNNKILSYILTFPSTFVMIFFTTTRPLIITYFLTILLYYILIKYIKTNKKKWLLILPIISILQINFQCSMWIFLFIMLMPFLFELKCFSSTGIYYENYDKKPILLSIIVMILSAFINPYGYKAMIYVFGSISSTNINITEMATPTILNASGTLIILFIVLITIIMANMKENINIRYLFLFWGSLALVLFAMRNLPYFGLAFSLILADILKNIDTENLLKKVFGVYQIYIPILTILLLGLTISNFVSKEKDDEMTAYKAIDYLTENYDINNNTIYTTYNDGAYALYNDLKVYLDSRQEVYLKSQNNKFDYITEYNNLQTGKIYYQDFIDKYKFDYMIINCKDIMYNFINEKGLDMYELIYKDNYCNLYQKVD